MTEPQGERLYGGMLVSRQEGGIRNNKGRASHNVLPFFNFEKS